MSPYLNFEQVGSTGKTKIFHVRSTSSGVVLGSIRWYNPWRCYAFWPTGETVFNEDCLDDLKDFIHEQMEARKSA